MTAAKARTRRGKGEPLPEPVVVQPLPDPEPTEPTPPTEVDGVKVVEIRPMPSPRGPKAFFRSKSLVELADGRVLAACTLCWFLGENRGRVQSHLMNEHGVGRPYSRRSRAELAELVVTEDKPSPELFEDPVVLALTLGEILEMTSAASEWGDLYADAERRHADELEALRVEMAELREALEMRIQEWRQRALGAESFKRKIIRRFSGLGFRLDEEGEA